MLSKFNTTHNFLSASSCKVKKLMWSPWGLGTSHLSWIFLPLHRFLCSRWSQWQQDQSCYFCFFLSAFGRTCQALSRVASKESWTPTLWAGLKELANGEFTVRAKCIFNHQDMLIVRKGQAALLSLQGRGSVERDFIFFQLLFKLWKVFFLAETCRWIKSGSYTDINPGSQVKNIKCQACSVFPLHVMYVQERPLERVLWNEFVLRFKIHQESV